MSGLFIKHGLVIPEAELAESFIQSSGPGGQNVNKVASAVQLSFDVARSPSLPETVRAALLALVRCPAEQGRRPHHHRPPFPRTGAQSRRRPRPAGGIDPRRRHAAQAAPRHQVPLWPARNAAPRPRSAAGGSKRTARGLDSWRLDRRCDIGSTIGRAMDRLRSAINQAARLQWRNTVSGATRTKIIRKRSYIGSLGSRRIMTPLLDFLAAEIMGHRAGHGAGRRVLLLLLGPRAFGRCCCWSLAAAVIFRLCRRRAAASGARPQPLRRTMSRHPVASGAPRAGADAGAGDAAGRAARACCSSTTPMRAVVGPSVENKPVSAVLRNPEVLNAIAQTTADGEPATAQFTLPVPIERHYEAYSRPGQRRAAGDRAGAARSHRHPPQRADARRFRRQCQSHELRTPLGGGLGLHRHAARPCQGRRSGAGEIPRHHERRRPRACAG